MIEFVAALVLGLFGAILLWKSQIGFMLALLLQLSLREFGLIANAEGGLFDFWTVWAFGFSIVTISVGYGVARRVQASRPREAFSLRPSSALPRSALWSMVIVASGLAIYHLVVGGIPLFASSIETSRFDFTSSGLFGIPGRMYLFGVNIVWFFASANAEALGIRWRHYGPWRLATATLALTSVLSGFKGELLSLAVTLVCTYVIISGVRLRVADLAKKYWWAAVAPLSYFVAVAGLYSTYTRSESSIWSLLGARATTVSAEPTQYALQFGAIYPGNHLLNDFGFFIAKYTGSGEEGAFTFERAVSASMIGVDPASHGWAPPVTIGGFAEVAVAVGVPVALVVMALTGAILGTVSHLPRGSASTLAVRAMVAWAVVSWILKGGFAYHVINFAAVLLMLLIVGFIGRMFFGSGATPGSLYKRAAITTSN